MSLVAYARYGAEGAVIVRANQCWSSTVSWQKRALKNVSNELKLSGPVNDESMVTAKTHLAELLTSTAALIRTNQLTTSA